MDSMKSPKKEIFAFDLMGNFYKHFTSITECAKNFNVSKNSIKDVLSGKGFSCKGYYFNTENKFSPRKKKKIGGWDHVNSKRVKVEKIKPIKNIILPKNFIWKEFEDSGYFVSSCGKIYSTKTNRFLKLRSGSNNEYLMSHFKGKTRLVHRLVALLFLENSEKNQVNHINKNKLGENHNRSIKLEC